MPKERRSSFHKALLEAGSDANNVLPTEILPEIFEDEDESALAKLEMQKYEAYQSALKIVQQRPNYKPNEKESLKEAEKELTIGITNDFSWAKPEVRKTTVIAPGNIKYRVPPIRKNVPKSCGEIVDELVEGEVLTKDEAIMIQENSGSVNVDGVHAARCLECLRLLKTEKLASLVFCKHCKTVSPNCYTQ